MTLFKTPLASAPTVPAGLGACPNWSNDQERITKLADVIKKLRAEAPYSSADYQSFGKNIKNNVLVIGAPNNIAVGPHPTIPGNFQVKIPTTAVKAKVDIYYMAEFTNVFAIDYLRGQIENGRSGSSSTGAVYVELRDFLLAGPGPKEGFTSLTDVHSILDETVPVNFRLDLMRTLPYDYKGATPSALEKEEKVKEIYSKMAEILQKYVLYESQCLWSYLFSSYVPPISAFLAVGDGDSTTKGLYKIDDFGVLFFNYTIRRSTSAGGNYAASSESVAQLSRIGDMMNTVAHINVYGMDYPFSASAPDEPMLIEITNTSTGSGAAQSISIEVKNSNTEPFTLHDYPSVRPTSSTVIQRIGNNLIVKDINAGKFAIKAKALKKINPNAPPYDEAVVAIFVVQERQQNLSFELDSENQYGSNEFVLRRNIKYVNPAATPLVWRIWNDPKSIENMDIILDELLAYPDKKIKTKLIGKDIGKRARFFSTSIAFKIGDLTYFNGDVYECKKATSSSPTAAGGSWKLLYAKYTPALVYNTVGEVTVVPHPTETERYRIYKSNARGISGVFDPTKWTQLPALEQETNMAVFDKLIEEPHYPSLKYSFGNVKITDDEIEFMVTSFVSPQLCRLDKGFLNQSVGRRSSTITLAQINDFNVKYTTSKGRNDTPTSLGRTDALNEVLTAGSEAITGLNTSTTPIASLFKIPIYNIPLSCLRSFGFWRALSDRILDRIEERKTSSPATLTSADASTLTTKFTAAFNGASVKIPLVRVPGNGVRVDENPSRVSARFTVTQWDAYQWQPNDDD
jgi:hypothetical protein